MISRTYGKLQPSAYLQARNQERQLMLWVLSFTRARHWIGIACALAIGSLVSPAVAKYKVIYSFCSQAACADGKGPGVGMIMDAQGNFFGTTGRGGANDAGVVFQLVHKGHRWKEKVLYSFCSEENCTDGSGPNVPLIMDTSGDLYGIAVDRGLHGFGNIFELTPNARRTKWTLHVLHGFCEIQNPRCGDGSFALGGLSYFGMSTGALYDGLSPLYGTTAYDGAYGGGVVYQLTHTQDTWTETPIYSFCAKGLPCIDGSSPQASVFVDASSNVFGAAAARGPYGGGVIFKLTRLAAHKGDWTEKVLYSFCSLADCADGSFPNSQPLFDSQGNMFGTTPYGGAANQHCIDGYDCGVLFELAPSGAQSVLHAFCSQPSCADGSGPRGNPTSDASGNLYGVTSGIDGPGTLFKFDGSLEVLHTFCSKENCTDGYGPLHVTLLTDQAGNMFGTAGSGGPYGGGVVFEWVP